MKFVLAHDKDQSDAAQPLSEEVGVRFRSSDLFAAKHVLTDDHTDSIQGAKVMIYVGLDVSLNSVAICVVDETGKIILEGNDVGGRAVDCAVP
ncbi:hypothetical protein IVB27_00145 [Bradyrhizobium sp. 197]|uniref:hypothetical protein n=1 Tax=Bradyrhizobium sp. 197 TaxID=2782663 RepID=UPI001FFB0503|nr:hypothetical protein [Bradyrhizobium sp. 197]MCK1473243.1 hypothetical protein [Bradyrhizobium sp. 197]